MLALVVAGGELLLSARVRSAARDAELVIAVDSGARHLDSIGRRADLLLGDFDSYVPGPEDGEVLRFPTRKDQTDTHLALRAAKSRGARRIILLGGMRGARLDHGAANLLLLAANEFQTVDLCAIDGEEELRAVRRREDIDGHAGDLVTLLALTRMARGVTTVGLEYPLSGATLKRGDSLGVSNAMLGERATVSLQGGILLLIHRTGGDPNRLG